MSIFRAPQYGFPVHERPTTQRKNTECDGKRAWATATGAYKALIHITKHSREKVKPVRVYRCGTCGCYHLTSTPMEKFK